MPIPTSVITLYALLQDAIIDIILANCTVATLMKIGGRKASMFQQIQKCLSFIFGSTDWDTEVFRKPKLQKCQGNNMGL